MTSPEPTISPRGVPPIRPDWLVDVAWRLSELGLGRLRRGGEDTRYALEDSVDGAPWRFDAIQLSEPWATSVELDADLHIPADTGSATLRAGFQLTPWWDPELGRCVQARIEIGPRGPVTFDPENWFVLLPLTGETRTGAAGVEAGAWTVAGTELPEPTPGVAAALQGEALALADVARLKPEARIPELLLAAGPLVKKGGLIGRGRLIAGAPTAIASLAATGAIDASWTGAEPLPEAIEQGHLRVEAVEAQAGQVTFRGAEGVLTLTGPELVLSVEQPASA